MKTKEEIRTIIREARIDELSKLNASKKFGETVAAMRSALGLTQADLCSILGVSKHTLVRIESGETERIDFNVALKASVLFKLPIREMCGFRTKDLNLYYNLMHSTKRTQRLIASILETDIQLAKNMKNYLPDEKYLIDCIKLADDIRDGIPCNRFYHDTINISKYRTYSWFSDADALLEINSNAYHPLYHIDDKLVISCESPRDGDIGIFMRDACFYLRKYVVNGENVTLNYLSFGGESNEYFKVNRYRIEDMNKWVKFGTVLAVI